MKIISSTDNNLIKKFRSLSVKKYREQFGLCLLEGKKVVLEALNQKDLVEYLIIHEDDQNAFLDVLKMHNDKCIVVTGEVYNSLAFSVTPQKIMAVIKIAKPKNIDCSKNLLVLDHLQDPGNLGTIIRSGIASNHTEIILIDSVDPYNDKTIRSATGTIFYPNFHTMKMEEFISFVKTNKLNIVVADMDGENIFNKNIKITTPYALVIGSEGKGVSDDILKLQHQTISIPMENNVESLNAAVSASIIMFNLNNRV